MGIVTATELPTLAGKAPSSSNLPTPSPAVPDEEALSTHYIPADGLSACLISPSRILVTAGACEDDRVLPFSVIRYLDLSPNPSWTKPHHLRRKRGSTDIPVPRVEHSLTYVPHDGRLYLFGGMKIDPDMGDICKTLFAFDPKTKAWRRVETPMNRTQGHMPGPRYAHSAVYANLREPRSRPNSRVKPAPSLVVYGGYATRGDHVPRSDLHVLNIRTAKWALLRVNGSLKPARANHAAVVTACQKFMLVHGGNHSDDDDQSVISDELFVFNFQCSQWFIPVRHTSSCNPPTARRRHSLVNGVGRHDGWLIMYGGHLRDGNFSSDMYMCKIVESEVEKVAVVWEKVDVRGTIHRPVDSRTKDALKRRTVAGGCLVPIPKLKKYILLGGRGELGIRQVPLLLDPYESDEVAMSQSVPVEEEIEDEVTTLRERAAMNAGKRRNARERKYDVNDEDDADDSDRGEDIIFDMEKNTTLQGVTPRRSRRVRSALSTPPGEKSSSAHRMPSVSVTPSEKSPTSSAAVDKSGADGNVTRPATNINGAVVVKLRVTSDDKKKVEDSPSDDDFLSALVIKKRPRSGAIGENITPPPKRGHFVSPEESDDIPDDIAPLDFGDEDSPVGPNKDSASKSLSYRSDFVSASELARKGKKAGRGRGRGRGRGGAGARARSADDRAEEKRREALEKLNEKNEERIAYLEAERVDLFKENSELKKDNHNLNEQHKRLLEDVRMSRVKESARKKDTVTAACTQTRKPNGSAAGSQVENNGGPSSVPEIDSLRATIAELQAEIAQKTTEKEGLVSTVTELEEEKRDVQKELFMMKNKFARTVIDRDSYHKEMKELRKDVSTMTKDKEAADNRAQKAEEELKLQQGEAALLKADIMLEKQRRKDGKLELSTADRTVKEVRDQLAEAAKRSDDMAAREKQVKSELEKAEERNSCLERQLDEAHTGNRKLEDEKIEISSQLESTRIELHGKIKECSAALKDAEKSREALERERLKRVNEDVGGDYVRMKAEVERTKKECSVLRARCERFVGLKDILPRLEEISKGVSAVFENDKEAEDVDVALSQARAEDRLNGITASGKKGVGERENSVKGGLQGNEEARTGCMNEESSVNQMKSKEAVVGDAVVQIPDSDDVDEP